MVTLKQTATGESLKHIPKEEGKKMGNEDVKLDIIPGIFPINPCFSETQNLCHNHNQTHRLKRGAHNSGQR